MPTQTIRLEIRDDSELIARIEAAVQAVDYRSAVPVLEKELVDGNKIIAVLMLETSREKANRLMYVLQSWKDVAIVKEEFTDGKYC